MMKMNWTKEWPKTPGSYWFYGWRFGSWIKDHDPELSYVEVRKTMNSIAYITSGHLLYKSEGARGFWKKCELPELPLRYP